MKPTPMFVCSNCDAQFTKWNGRCLECGKWGTIGETAVMPVAAAKQDIPRSAPIATVSLADIQGKDLPRLETGLHEIDRVFGPHSTSSGQAGIVPGSLTLLGGEPGIGKSTLSLQLALKINHTLYISGEESTEQIKMRASRLRLPASSLRLANHTDLDAIIATIRAEKPALTIIDSIQTISLDGITGEAGNVTQVRACTALLLECAKATGTAIILIGHVTKDGDVAGPRTLEHLVDTVLYLEGDRYHNVRILRATKNRFGSTDEVGMFEMKDIGLQEIDNPSAAFLAERGASVPGTVLTCLIEGTRPILVEVQALVTKTSFGYPVRKASGFDLNRLHVLVAVLQKRANLNLAQYDIHLNIAGGLRANEPAADLAVCLAIASAFKDKQLGLDLACFGEVGLGGEIRSVRATDKRIRECEVFGLKRVILGKQKSAREAQEKIKLIEVENIGQLITQT